MSLLEVNALTMRFGGVVALDGLSLSLESGQILGLIGPNGSGKTTCFNIMTGLYAPSHGRVMFDAKDLTGLSPQAVHRSGIARTFQRSRLCLPLSIFDNIMLGNHLELNQSLWFNLVQRRAFRAQYEAALDQARALIARFNADLLDHMFDAVETLPMIDRRRIEICRALVSGPRLLLLDEPSAGMTHEETRRLMDDIVAARGENPDLTIIIIEHEMGVIERVTDRCVVLNYGRKIADGPYQDVASDENVRTAYLGTDL